MIHHVISSCRSGRQPEMDADFRFVFGHSADEISMIFCIAIFKVAHYRTFGSLDKGGMFTAFVPKPAVGCL
jgi:hypothetical protein